MDELCSQTQIKNWIEHWIKNRSKVKSNSIVDYIFDNDGIDSFSIIELILDIEKNFSIKLNDEDFINKKFNKINGLSEIIFEKL
jgi:acyl carrier protein